MMDNCGHYFFRDEKTALECKHSKMRVFKSGLLGMFLAALLTLMIFMMVYGRSRRHRYDRYGYDRYGYDRYGHREYSPRPNQHQPNQHQPNQISTKTKLIGISSILLIGFCIGIVSGITYDPVKKYNSDQLALKARIEKLKKDNPNSDDLTETAISQLIEEEKNRNSSRKNH